MGNRMPRKPIDDKPMLQVERRRKSDAAKIERGEQRITTWISRDAAKALHKITGGSQAKGVIQEAINNALLNYVRD